MKQNLSVLHAIQHVFFGKENFCRLKFMILFVSLIYSRLAFLPIYFTAHETGRHQVSYLNF